jgi:predicted nucleic acid-binding protein
MSRCNKNGGITNTLALAESFNVLEKATNKEVATKAIKIILKSNVKVLDLNINTFFQALKKFNKYNLSIYDMIHYTTALLNNCKSILTYDSDFDNLEIQREEP